jgi:hypothetical protein
MYQGPPRDWRTRSLEAVRVLSAALRTPQGSGVLRPIQAAALLEGYENNGVYLNAAPGDGKTLTSGLIPTLMRSKGFQRPLILVPASLLKKTEAEFAAYRKDWRVATFYRLESYTAMSLEKNAELLKTYRPDLIVCDEAHALRRLKDAAAPKRLLRWHEEAPQTACFFMSGTFLKDKITDYAHLLALALGAASPLPTDPVEIDAWSLAIDCADQQGLTAFGKYFAEPIRSYDHAKELYRTRLRGAPGVIISDDKYGGSLLIIRAQFDDPGLEQEFHLLKTEYRRPDGWDLADASEDEPPDFAQAGSIWSVERQLALGFYYSCDPPPPKDWMLARRAWFGFVREVIASGACDTELQVRKACEAGAQIPEEWLNWRAIRETFVPNRKAVWLSSHAIDHAKAWGRAAPGIIWVDHLAFGQRLAAETGWRYFGQGGLDAEGKMIESAQPFAPIIASRLANQYGRNLQAWNRNLIMALPNAARDGEQLFARTHRNGQTSAHVAVDLYLACAAHEKSLHNLKAGATHSHDTQGLTQRIQGAKIGYSGQRPESSWAFYSKN